MNVVRHAEDIMSEKRVEQDARLKAIGWKPEELTEGAQIQLLYVPLEDLIRVIESRKAWHILRKIRFRLKKGFW